MHQKATMDAAMELEASGKREVELRLQVERLQGELRATQEGAAVSVGHRQEGRRSVAAWRGWPAAGSQRAPRYSDVRATA